MSALIETAHDPSLWLGRKARLLAGLSPLQVAVLEQLYGRRRACSHVAAALQLSVDEVTRIAGRALVDIGRGVLAELPA